MNIFGKLTLATSIGLVLTVPALAGVTVTSPSNGSSITSSFKLSAYATSCSSQPVVSMGYSFDSSSNTRIFYSQSISTSVSSATGTHVLHVKAWGKGTACVTDVTVNVTAATASTTAVSIPSYADSNSDLQVLNWQYVHDSGGPGWSSGYTDLVTSPSLYGTTRRTVTSFSNNGDERYSTVFSDNNTAENFFYDGWVYLTSSSQYLANLEFDINQTMSNGQTVLTGVQCDGWTGNWAYTANIGSASSPRPSWIKASGTSCNPRNWKQYTWHHIQASISRNNSGYITYHAVWLDGVETQLNATVYGAANLGWGPAVTTQFQVDGYGSSGHVTAYLDHLKISMW